MVNPRGVVLIFAVILLSVLLVLVGAVMMMTRQARASANNSVNSIMADLSAKTGLNDAQRVIRLGLTSHTIVTNPAVNTLKTPNVDIQSGIFDPGIYNPAIPDSYFLNISNDPSGNLPTVNGQVRVNPLRYFQADVGDTPYAMLDAKGEQQTSPAIAPLASFINAPTSILFSPSTEAGWAYRNVMKDFTLPASAGLSADFLFSTNNTNKSVKTLHENRDGSNPVHIGSERGEYYVWVEDMDSRLYGRPQGWGIDTTNAQGGTPLQNDKAVQTGVLKWLLDPVTNTELTSNGITAVQVADIPDALVSLEDKSTTPPLRSMQELALWVPSLDSTITPYNAAGRAALDYYFTAFKDEANFAQKLPTKFCKDYKTAININTAPVEVIAAALSQIPSEIVGETLTNNNRCYKIAERIVAKRPFLCRMDFEDYLAAQIKGTTNNPTASTTATQTLPEDTDALWNDPNDAIWTDADGSPISYVLYFGIGRRPGPGNTLINSNKVLVAGGDNGGAIPTSLASADRYDYSDPTNPTGLWVPATSPTARTNHTATLLPNGKVLVVGGESAFGIPLNTAELYTPASNTWTAAGTLTTARFNHTATLLPNGKVLVAGGMDEFGTALDTSELYTPSVPYAPAAIPPTNPWTEAFFPLSSARYSHTATLLPNGQVLVVGGQDDFGTLDSAEFYDPDDESWNDAGLMVAERSNHTATLLPNGKVLIAGGDDATGNALNTTELYDPLTDVWSAAGILGTARTRHTATLLTNGKVLVAGGDSGSPLQTSLASAELYDTGTNTWSSTGALLSARARHTATLLTTGKVWVSGGSDSGLILTSTEVFDPDAGTSGTWSAATPLSTVRINHTATLLPTDNLYRATAEMSLSQYLEIPGVVEKDSAFQMTIKDEMVPTTPTPIDSWPNEPRYQRARFRYFFDETNRAAAETEGSLITVKEFNNILNSVTNIFVNDDVQRNLPNRAVTIQTTPVGDDYYYDPSDPTNPTPANPTEIRAGLGGGQTFAMGNDVQINTPNAIPFSKGTTMVLVSVLVTAGVDGKISTTPQGDDYYYFTANPDPTQKVPFAIVAGPSHGSTWVSSNRPSYYSYSNDIVDLNNFWEILDASKATLEPLALNFDFDITGEMADPAVITKKSDERTLANKVRIYTRCKTNLASESTRPATQIDDLKSWRALPVPNTNPAAKRLSGFYQTTFDGDQWTYPFTATTVNDYGFLQSLDDPASTAITAPPARSTALMTSGLNANGDVSWSPQFAFRSRFYHIYVLGRGLIAPKEGATAKLSGETRMEAIYDALEDKPIWTRTQLSEKRALGEE